VRNRYEGRPRAIDLERALRAEVRDALWFLTRQWQLGELQGEDAGSPVEVRTALRCTPLRSFAARGGGAVAYDVQVPLEARVEREHVPADLVTHVQISRAFFGRLRGSPELHALRALYLAAYPLTESACAGALDDVSRQILMLARDHAFDGTTFLEEVANGAHATRVDGFGGLSAAVKSQLEQTGHEVAAAFARVYEQPSAAEPSAWSPGHLEYQFACAAEAKDVPPTTLVAEQYTGGRLDWHSFDIDARPQARLVAEPTPPLADAPPRLLSFLPAPASFAGMPSHRYWEMENRRIEFAAIDAQTTDIAKLLLMEFALIHGNDWCVIPCEVEVGSLCEILGLIVTDTFGGRMLVGPAGRGRGEAGQRWMMFTLSTNDPSGRADTRLFVAPTLPAGMEGAPLEKVVFLRDEMANMAWGVERVVPTALGTGGDGYAIARALAPQPPLAALQPTPALVRYVLGTDVPENWRPFVPVRVPGSSRSIQLQRARMPGPERRLLGEILEVPTPYYLHEEEVPRAGKIVTRSPQRVRWLGGRTFTWFGRRVLAGRGEGSSGLVFDQVQPIEKEGAGGTG
jgi:hypothetical protein